MHSENTQDSSNRPQLLSIGVLVVIYAAATMAGLTTPSAQHGPSHGEAHAADNEADHGHGSTAAMPAYYAVIPFALLLAAIATFPLLPATEHWWESNLHRFYVASSMAAVTITYYLFIHHGGGVAKTLSVLDHAILKEYVPFIVLLFSLYTISGGIRIHGDLPAHPLTNSIFLIVGGLLASFIGTTGAAMLLIRPLLETNDERKHVQHTVVFFIFVVCNCGGCLLPIGDPPLFLGYLEGVEFMWTMWNLWPAWLVANSILIFLYYSLDRVFFYPRETPRDICRDERVYSPMRVEGLWPNALLLVGIILSVALLDPSKTLPGTDWRPWVYLREIVQLALVGLSLCLGSREVRRANRFNYHAIVEVAALFIGIFICMQPAIEILNVEGPNLGINTSAKFFWATGGLSAVLDNAPTYVVFFKTADALFPGQDLAEMVSANPPDPVANLYLIGISLGAVFLGAMTYIGNGPNFMVRAIAEQSGVRMPSFFGYALRYSIPVLIPVFLLTALIFLRSA